jgi:cell wall-associated NlpC family hydrolase
MDWYKDYRLVKDNDEYNVVITLNPNNTEFSEELISDFKENLLELDDAIRKLIEEKFSDVKVNSVKLMLGTAIVASIPFMMNSKVHAAEITSATTTSSQSAGITQLDTTGIVTASRLNMRSGPGTSYGIIHVLWQGNKVKVIGQSGDWYQIKLSNGRIGWVSSAYLQVDLRQQKIDTVIATAKSLLGTPYVWGGESLEEGGFDCSGLTLYIFQKAGYTLNRISSEQAKQGVLVSRQDLQPGDLIFYSFEANGVINHVGLYIGEGKMIHSPKTGDVVKTTDITTSYWQTRFVTARRII